MKKFLLSIALTALTIPASAQLADIFAAYVNGRTVGVVRSADDTDPAYLVKYVGTSASATVEVSSAGDITLKHGALSSEAADSTVKCPSGGSSGVIDVSDADCNTVGEVINAINASNNWVAVPVAALLSDSSNDTLATKSATLANTSVGVPLYIDTDVALTSTVLLNHTEFTSDIGTYLAGISKSGVELRLNPFVTRTFLASARGTSTYGSGTSTWSVIQVKPSYKRSSSTESVKTLLSGIAGGATTVQGTLVSLSDNNRIVSDDNTKLLVRITNSAAMASVTQYAFGYTFVGK